MENRISQSTPAPFPRRAAIPLHVVKVGGSLFNWPELAVALRAWLSDQPPAVSIVICGGGAEANRVREADRALHFGELVAERLAIRCMQSNIHFLARVLGRLQVISDYSGLLVEIRRRRRRHFLMFDPETLLGAREATLNARHLPHNWSVTSDSIAAWLAELLNADELVLLKSADPPSGDFHHLATVGYLDSFFPQIAPAVRSVRLVNIRAYRSL